jgi:hypothetical protein
MTPIFLSIVLSAPGLAGVVNAEKAKSLPRAARAQLERQGFTTIEGRERHFFSLYDKNAYQKVPSFISSDVVLHVFHVRFDEELREVERARAIPALRALATGQLGRALEKWPTKGAPDATTEATALYHATALKLLEPAKPLDARVDAKAAQAARALADAKASTVTHPACPAPLDATRFTPRGHYDHHALREYFRAFTFYSLCAFPMPAAAERARAIAALLDAPARASLSTLTALVEFVGGKTNSPTVDALLEATGSAPGKEFPPFRLLGAADTSDSALLERAVKARLAAKHPNPLPSALDVFAALGSTEARELLTPPQPVMEPLVLGESLSERWLRVLQGLVSAAPATAPAFAASSAWKRRTLVTAGGSWAELKHDTLLSVHQPEVMMEGGDDAELPATKVGGYVDPRPDVYRELLALVEALEAAAARPAPTNEAPGTLRNFLRFIVEVSELELANAPFPQALDARLRTVGSELEHLSRTHGDEAPTQALIADVFTLADGEGTSRVFHVATGRVDELWVLAPRVGKRVLMRGGAFSFYEVTTTGERLTDAAWADRLATSSPERPSWARPVPLGARPRLAD